MLGLRSRSCLGLLAALIWLLGIELLPGAHVALHAHLAPHSHDGDPTPTVVSKPGAAVTVRVSHVEGSPELRRSERPTPARRPASDDPTMAMPRPDPVHGRYSLAHRAILFHAPPPALLVPTPIWIATRVDPPAPGGHAPLPIGVEPASRGPPAPTA